MSKLGLCVSSGSHLKAESGENFAATALEFRARRQAVIASNIANSDVPNYLARDISFADALNSISASGQALRLSSASKGHLIDRPSGTRSTFDFAQFTSPGQPSVDGNSVDLNIERSKLAKNTILYQFATQMLDDEVKEFKQAASDPRR